MKKHSFLGPIIAMIVPYIFFEALRSGALLDPEFFKPEGHFYIVTAVAVLATFIAIAIGIAGRRLRNIKVTFLALSFPLPKCFPCMDYRRLTLFCLRHIYQVFQHN